MITGIRFLLVVLFLGQTARLSAAIRLPALFSDHMVVMRSRSAPVWGKAEAGETVTVEFVGKTWRTVAGDDGRWLLHMDLEGVGAGPFQLVAKGRNEIVVSDVLVGTVWLAAGQSNMELPLQATRGAEAEIARSANTFLRVFRVAKSGRPGPAEDCSGSWAIAGPKTAGAFTAVGYYFGQRLQNDLRQPVGIIDASWAGSYSEMWMSEEAIRSVDSIHAGDTLRRTLLAGYPKRKQEFVAAYAAWLEAFGRKDRPNPEPARFAGENIATEGWSTVQLPGRLFERPVTGAFWIRKVIDVPERALTTGQPFKVLLGDIEGFDEVYWNGEKVSETSYEKYPGLGYPRYFPVPDRLLKAGKNTIAVRIFAPASSPRVTNAPGRFWAAAIDLAGDWLAKVEYEFPALPATAFESTPKAPPTPPLGNSGVIFNGVINPLTSAGIDGVLWYQGESDTPRAYEYRAALRALIADWREKWKRPDLPFYICQLHGHGSKNAAPGESEYAELRESQAATLSVPGTAMTVLVDLGESDDDHPRNKKDVGERLATLVLAKQFGKKLVYSGPVFHSQKIEGDRIRIQFRHTDGGLIARPLPEFYDVNSLAGKTAPLIRNSPKSVLEGFAICGADRRWVWADARIEGDAVVVWSAQVARPIAVRYGWADFPTVNLANGSGLPAAPFRTDDFPAYTLNNHYGATP
ncbi:MAG: acetylesterase [Candidatus Solibacter sp.]|nr:acetylesterase [Candidatus Solibacter sp.]